MPDKIRTWTTGRLWLAALVGALALLSVSIWFVRMTPDQFEMIAGGIQSLAITFGVIGGGLWGYYQFRVQRADREQDRLAVFEVNMKVELAPAHDGLALIHARIEMSNVGSRASHLAWDSAPLLVARVSPMEIDIGGYTWGPDEPVAAHSLSVLHDEDMTLTHRSVYLPPRGSATFSALIPATTPGVYQLAFKYEVGGKEQKDAAQSLGPGEAHQFLYGSASAFVVVPITESEQPGQ